jgi:hypothetical protein
MSETETFSSDDMEDMIIDNKTIVKQRGECFDVNREEVLSQILDNVNSL